MRVPILLILLMGMLAGCAQDVPTDAPGAVATGSIRGIVVDIAVNPLPDTRVQVLGGPNVTTDGAGNFRFDGLTAATYQLVISKDGFFDGRAAAVVVAGVAEPAIIKVVLEHDPQGARYVEEQAFEGFVQWGFSAGGVRGSNSDAPDLEFARVPDLLQIELVWESTQALGDAMEITLIAFEANATTGDGFKVVQGSSPLHVKATKDELVAAGVGGDTYVAIAIFSAVSEPFPAALTVDQPFTLFIHAFYGYTPPETWIFTQDGAYPPP